MPASSIEPSLVLSVSPVTDSASFGMTPMSPVTSRCVGSWFLPRMWNTWPTRSSLLFCTLQTWLSAVSVPE